MTSVVRDLMTPIPTIVAAGTSVGDAARTMRDQDLGAVLVDTGAGPAIVTDRDIVVRGIATGEKVVNAPIAAICSRNIVSISPESQVDEAVTVMRDHAVRRLVVMDGGKPVGLLSIADVVVERDPHSLLGEISKAVPNR